jgi:hypothetical protein
VYTGSVYIYGSVGTIWSRQSKLLAADGSGGDLFAISVCIFGSTAMVGALYDDDRAGDAGMHGFEINYYYTIRNYCVYYTFDIFSCRRNWLVASLSFTIY